MLFVRKVFLSYDNLLLQLLLSFISKAAILDFLVLLGGKPYFHTLYQGF